MNLVGGGAVASERGAAVPQNVVLRNVFMTVGGMYAISALVAWMHPYPPWLPGMHTVGDAALGVPSPATSRAVEVLSPQPPDQRGCSPQSGKRHPEMHPVGADLRVRPSPANARGA